MGDGMIDVFIIVYSQQMGTLVRGILGGHFGTPTYNGNITSFSDIFHYIRNM